MYWGKKAFLTSGRRAESLFLLWHLIASWATAGEGAPYQQLSRHQAVTWAFYVALPIPVSNRAVVIMRETTGSRGLMLVLLTVALTAGSCPRAAVPCRRVRLRAICQEVGCDVISIDYSNCPYIDQHSDLFRHNPEPLFIDVVKGQRKPDRERAARCLHAGRNQILLCEQPQDPANELRARFAGYLKRSKS